MKETSLMVNEVKDRIVANLQWHRELALQQGDYGAVRAFEIACAFVLAEPLLPRYREDYEHCFDDEQISCSDPPMDAGGVPPGVPADR